MSNNPIGAPFSASIRPNFWILGYRKRIDTLNSFFYFWTLYMTPRFKFSAVWVFWKSNKEFFELNALSVEGLQRSFKCSHCHWPSIIPVQNQKKLFKLGHRLKKFLTIEGFYSDTSWLLLPVLLSLLKVHSEAPFEENTSQTKTRILLLYVLTYTTKKAGEKIHGQFPWITYVTNGYQGTPVLRTRNSKSGKCNIRNSLNPVCVKSGLHQIRLGLCRYIRYTFYPEFVITGLR